MKGRRIRGRHGTKYLDTVCRHIPRLGVAGEVVTVELWYSDDYHDGGVSDNAQN